MMVLGFGNSISKTLAFARDSEVGHFHRAQFVVVVSQKVPDLITRER
jgi:hypothetical protein